MSENANVATLLERTAARYPDATAVILDGERVTYAGLLASCRRLAGWMRREGIEPGDRVALLLPNIQAFPVVFFAVLQVGAIVVPMNPLFKRREIEYYLEDSGATALWSVPSEEAEAAAAATGTRLVSVGPEGLHPFIGADVADPVDGIATLEPDDLALVLYTSGTTGPPKGAELTHRNLGTNTATLTETLFHLAPDDVVLGCLPLFHVFGLACGLLSSVSAGASLTLMSRFDPAKALQVIERDRVTVLLGVPTMYAAMLGTAGASSPSTSADGKAPSQGPADLSSLRLAVSAGASMPVEVLRKFEATFPCTILEGFGMSELIAAAFNHPDRPRKVGSIGTALRGVELKLVTPEGRDVAPNDAETIGELWIRGENVMRGYWGRPEATTMTVVDGGWLRSGDLARRDADGYYFVVDRMKDLIKRGGMSVYPREIEEILYEHPAVTEAAVIGAPHSLLGEEVAAVVVLAQGASATADELVDFVRSRVAPYKYPRHVTLIDALPKNATGKILKRELVAAG